MQHLNKKYNEYEIQVIVMHTTENNVLCDKKSLSAQLKCEIKTVLKHVCKCVFCMNSISFFVSKEDSLQAIA